MSKRYTAGDIWDHFLESDDDKIEIELANKTDAYRLKRAISVHKSRLLKDETMRDLLGAMRLNYSIDEIEESSHVLLTISLAVDSKEEGAYVATIRGLKD